MRIPVRTIAAAAFVALMSAQAQAQDLKALPGGGGLKDVPAMGDLPGVRMNLGSQAGPSANCVKESVSAFDMGGSYGSGGTLQRCSFGRFSVGTVTPNGFSGSSIQGMQQFHGHYHPIQPSWRPN